MEQMMHALHCFASSLRMQPQEGSSKSGFILKHTVGSDNIGSADLMTSDALWTRFGVHACL